MARTRAHINPDLFVWARKQVNADPEMLARRAGTSLDILKKWEKGEKRPTHRQLHKAADALGRSVAFFYLNEPPEEEQPRLEMRRVYARPPEKDSYEFSRQVHECMQRRALAIELYELLEEEPSRFTLRFELSQSPEDIATEIRKRLAVSVEDQFSWKGDYEALKRWRQALEKIDVLVFQTEALPLEQARGFAVFKEILPIVAFNSYDSVRGRIFTLLHEFAHVLLGESVLHTRSVYESKQQVERWCNQLAAAILVPAESLKNRPEILEKGSSASWAEKEVTRLARKYWVSPSALIRRLKNFGYISSASFNKLRKKFDARRSTPVKKQKKSKGGSHFNNVLARMGTKIPNLAFEGFNSGVLSTRDLSNIMGTRVASLGEFEEKITGVRHTFKS